MGQTEPDELGGSLAAEYLAGNDSTDSSMMDYNVGRLLTRKDVREEMEKEGSMDRETCIPQTPPRPETTGRPEDTEILDLHVVDASAANAGHLASQRMRDVYAETSVPISNAAQEVEKKSMDGSTPVYEHYYLNHKSTGHSPSPLLLHDGTWYAAIPGLGVSKTTKPTPVPSEKGLDAKEPLPQSDHPREQSAKPRSHRNFSSFWNDMFIFLLPPLSIFLILWSAHPGVVRESLPTPSTHTSTSISPAAQICPSRNTSSPALLEDWDALADALEMQLVIRQCLTLWCSWELKFQPLMPKEKYTYCDFDKRLMSTSYRTCFEACVPEKGMVDTMDCEDILYALNQGAIGECQYDHGDGFQLPKMLREEPGRTYFIKTCAEGIEELHERRSISACHHAPQKT